MRNLTALAVLLLMSAEPVQAVTLEPVIQGLTAPIDIADPNDGSDRLFVLEQHGVVQTLKDGTLGEPLLDLRPRLLELRQDFEERGLLGFALHSVVDLNLYVEGAAFTAFVAAGLATRGIQH